jgi:hypothetical protein
MAKHWEAEILDWKELALSNLAAQTDGNPGTHVFRRENGEIYGVAMMHPDGLGPSRLLLRDRLSKLFPSGYRVALPEMSCALAFSVDVDVSEMTTLQDIVDKCYQDGTRPLASGIYAPDDLLPDLG